MLIREIWRTRSREGLRRFAGAAWTAAWCAVLYAAARPWRDLGGWMDERLRWASWAALVVGLAGGFAVGRLARRAAIEGGRVTHATLVREVVVPVAAAGAAAAAALAACGQRDAVGTVVLGLLAVASGCDLAYAAVPLMDGEPYAFARPLPPPPDDDPEDDPPEARDRGPLL